jgi:tetratricopeptide (TPR) repeat protein
MDWLAVNKRLTKLPQTLLVWAIVLFCLALGMTTLDLADRDAYVFIYAYAAVFLVGALVCGVCGAASWKSISKRFKIASVVIMLLSFLMLPKLLEWCCQKALHPTHYKELMALEQAARKAMDDGNGAKAEQLYKSIMQKEQSGWFPGHSSNELALAYALEQQKKFKEAEQLYLQTLRTWEKTADSASLATCEQNLAIFYLDRKRYLQAEAFFKRALRLHNERHDRSWESMLCREDYAQVLRATDRTEEAEPLERDAKAIRNEIEGPH